MTKFNIGDKMPNFVMNTSSQNYVSMKELVNCKTVFWIIRYIGCTVCRYDVHLLVENYQRIKDKGYELYVVMQSDQEHVKNDLKDVRLPFDIICDNTLEIYHTLDIEAAKDVAELVGPKEALDNKGAKAKELGFVHGDYEGDELQLPALFIINQDLTISYVHYGKHITDMPSVDKLVEML